MDAIIDAVTLLSEKLWCLQVLEHGKDPAMVYSHAAEAKSRVLVDESALECPFAIDEKYDR
jgi:hypothetical protein